MIELEEENDLSKIGQKRHTDNNHIAIELSTLHMALVKVHQELGHMRLKAKDMAYKNKQARQLEKEHKRYLQELQDNIAEQQL